MKQVLILYSTYTPIIDAMIHELSDFQVECSTKKPTNINKYDLIISTNFEDISEIEVLKCHHSLLPAFNTEEPLRDAILSGAKVTGITIYFSKTKKILAQYPIFIQNDLHYDEIENELNYLEQVLFPIVVKKVLNNEIIDMKTILNKSSSNNGSCCGNSCSNCNGSCSGGCSCQH